MATKILAARKLANKPEEVEMLKKTVGNWVDGDRFFDRHDDLLVLREAVLVWCAVNNIN